jgi:hypothetical protein
VSASFASDLVPSWQPELLWDRVLYSDPAQYLPNFVSEGVLGSGPAHVPKLLAQVLAVTSLVYWLRERVADSDEHPRFSRDAAAGAGGVLVGALLLAALLERFPGNPAAPGKPSFRETRVLEAGREVSVEGAHGFEGEGVWVPGGGTTGFVLLTREPTPSLVLSFSNGPE